VPWRRLTGASSLVRARDRAGVMGKPKFCKGCGSQFISFWNRGYCSDACREAMNKPKRERFCRACGGRFISFKNRVYCSNACRYARWEKPKRLCPVCDRLFTMPMLRSVYCSAECYRLRAPAVYRFVCPDGRSYVGSRIDWPTRKHKGITATNSRLAEALAQYPAETWTFEILQTLPASCPKADRYCAEQQHIDRLRSWDPAFGFNMNPADRTVASATCRAAVRQRIILERRARPPPPR
jgi:hypothetical protein